MAECQSFTSNVPCITALLVWAAMTNCLLFTLSLCFACILWIDLNCDSFAQFILSRNQSSDKLVIFLILDFCEARFSTLFSTLDSREKFQESSQLTFEWYCRFETKKKVRRSKVNMQRKLPKFISEAHFSSLWFDIFAFIKRWNVHYR